MWDDARGLLTICSSRLSTFLKGVGGYFEESQFKDLQYALQSCNSVFLYFRKNQIWQSS